MTNRSTLLAGAATSFAHLVGLARTPVAAAPETPADEPNTDPNAAAAEDWESRAKTAEKRVAELEEELKTATAAKSDPDEDGDDDSDEEGDDDSDGEETSARAGTRANRTRKARLRERSRCAAIFADPAAGRNASLAAQLAFQTDLPRSKAVGVLQQGGGSGGLAARMAGAGVPPVPPDGARPPSQDDPKALADQVVNARNATGR